MSIQPTPPIDQGFPAFYRGLIARPRPDHYHAASLHAVALNNTQLVVYAAVAILANYGTRIADLKYKARVLRGWKSRRQLGRVLASLVARGYLVKHSQMHYSLTGRRERRNGSRLRPLTPAILQAAAVPETALYARFALAIAATRKRWDRWTWRDVRQVMRCDTATAQALYRGLQAVRGMGKGGTIQAARRAVFWSQRPEWYRYREHGGGRVLMDPRPGAAGLLQRPKAARSENVPPGVCRIGVYAKAVLTSRADQAGPELGGKPAARKRGRQSDREIAAKALRRTRRRQRRTSLDSLPGQVAAITATAGALKAPPPENNNPAGSVFESLIAGLPEAVRARFEQEPAVVAERRRRRIGLGYLT